MGGLGWKWWSAKEEYQYYQYWWDVPIAAADFFRQLWRNCNSHMFSSARDFVAANIARLTLLNFIYVKMLLMFLLAVKMVFYWKLKKDKNTYFHSHFHQPLMTTLIPSWYRIPSFSWLKQGNSCIVFPSTITILHPLVYCYIPFPSALVKWGYRNTEVRSCGVAFVPSRGIIFFLKNLGSLLPSRSCIIYYYYWWELQDASTGKHKYKPL